MAHEHPTLVVRPIDPYDDAEMQVLQDIYVAAERAEIPDAAVYSLEDAMALFRGTPLGTFYRVYAACEDGRMVGEGMLSGSTVDNLQTAIVWVWVPPGERGRGVGSAILDHLVEESRTMGRGVLQAIARYRADERDKHPYRRFAEQRGFALANVEVERRLPLPAPEPLLTSLATDAAAHAATYRLRTIVGSIPADVAQGYCDVINRLNLDAPTGDLVVEAGRRTPEILADQDRELREQGRTRLTVLALDPDDTVVALTCAVATVPGYPHIDQWATIVHPDHRGHRLGLAVKVAQIRALQATFPDKEFVSTTNAETNAHMVAINETLGFELHSLSAEFQRILPGFDAVAQV